MRTPATSPSMTARPLRRVPPMITPTIAPTMAEIPAATARTRHASSRARLRASATAVHAWFVRLRANTTPRMSPMRTDTMPATTSDLDSLTRISQAHATMTAKAKATPCTTPQPIDPKIHSPRKSGVPIATTSAAKIPAAMAIPTWIATALTFSRIGPSSARARAMWASRSRYSRVLRQQDLRREGRAPCRGTGVEGAGGTSRAGTPSRWSMAGVEDHGPGADDTAPPRHHRQARGCRRRAARGGRGLSGGRAEGAPAEPVGGVEEAVGPPERLIGRGVGGSPLAARQSWRSSSSMRSSSSAGPEAPGCPRTCGALPDSGRPRPACGA